MDNVIMEMIQMVIGGIGFLSGVALTLVGAYANKTLVWLSGLGTVALGLIIMGVNILI